MFFDPKFEDITMDTQTIHCNVKLSKFNGRFRLAQIWLDQEFVKKMEPVVPKKTGHLLTTIKTQNFGKRGSGEIVTTALRYGRRLYPGINPRTGLPFHWTNPMTQPRWGTYTYNMYKGDFNRGIKHILLKGKYPDA